MTLSFWIIGIRAFFQRMNAVTALILIAEETNEQGIKVETNSFYS